MVASSTSTESQKQKFVPDILDVISALSSDAIPTPPVLANALLDLLPDPVWTNPRLRWLNPASKSGSILREVVRRLMIGLTYWEPDPHKRADHILRNMVFGCGTTMIHGEMSRRSVYGSRDASGGKAFIQMGSANANIPFVDGHHTFKKNSSGRAVGACQICSAPLSLERGTKRENHAYAFIHDSFPTKEMSHMKFDVIVGNPPYQTGDGKTSESPLYHLFIEKAIALDPKYVAMIVPSRWFNGGKTILDDFRARMIEDRRLRVIVDNPKLFDCFPGVEIKGGVNYFLWDRDYNGDCEFSTRIDGVVVSTSSRDLRDGDGVVVRDNKASGIIAKCRPKSEEGSLSSWFSSQFPFGQSITTNFAGAQTEPFEGSIPLIFASHVGYVRRSQIERNLEWIEKWKVIVPVGGDGHGREVSYVIGEPIALAPGSACTQTFLVAGVFDTALEAENLARYLTTKLARFLILQRKSTQHIKPDKLRFVPILDFKRQWTDEDLYSHFKLSVEEVAYIEQSIHPREAILSLESSIPKTHLPGGHKYRAPGERFNLEEDEAAEED